MERARRTSKIAALPADGAMRILVVEDFDDTREMYVEYLSAVGFQAAGARDGVAGVEAAIRIRPHVVVMDLSLPELDGTEATRIIKTNPLTCDAIVIVVTGHAVREHLTAAKAAGADEVLTKPLIPAQLEAAIRRVMHRREAEAGARSKSNEAID